MQLLLGKPVYMDDITQGPALVVKLLRSPHANALVREVKTAAALKVPGVEAVYTWEDVPKTRFTIAGQTYPEPSPYDRLILDRHVRFVGDPVAIIAAETEKAALRAMKPVSYTHLIIFCLFGGKAGDSFQFLYSFFLKLVQLSACLLYTSKGSQPVCGRPSQERDSRNALNLTVKKRRRSITSRCFLRRFFLYFFLKLFFYSWSASSPSFPISATCPRDSFTSPSLWK